MALFVEYLIGFMLFYYIKYAFQNAVMIVARKNKGN